MTAVQDNHLACRDLQSNLGTPNMKIFSFSQSNARDGHANSDLRVQDHLQPRQAMLDNNVRGAPSAQTSSGKTPFLVILTADQARMIYSLRSESTAQSFELRSVAGKSSLVAELYGVSPKTIRDVWNRKTWTQVSS